MAAVIVIPNNGKNSEAYQQVNEETSEYSSAIEMSKLLMHAVARMTFQIIMLTDRKKVQTVVVLFTRSMRKYKVVYE